MANNSTPIALPYWLTHPVVTAADNSKVSEANNQKRYKAYFRHVTEHDKVEFKTSSCILLISVGRDYHEGGQLSAIMALVNKSFKECTVLVADTLQRYSLAITDGIKTTNELHDIALLKGQEWLQRNDKYLAQLTIPHQILRWNNLLSHKEFSKYMGLVNELYRHDIEYKEATNAVANEFIDRSEIRKSNKGRIFDAVVNYLLEESAVSCIWIQDNNPFDVYPAGDNRAMMMAYEKLLKPSGLKYRSLSLNIKKSNTIHHHDKCEFKKYNI